MILENNFPPDVRVEKEIKSLITAGHEITLACSSPKSENCIMNWHNAKIIKKKMPDFIYKSSVICLRFPFYFNYWRRFLESIFNKYEFNAIHLHDLPLAKVAKELSVKHKIPFVLDLHENWADYMDIAAHTNTFLGKILVSSWQWHNYEIRMSNKADKIITVVEEMKDRIVCLGIDPKKIYILPNTVCLEDQQLLVHTKSSTKFTLFYGGGINIHRGLQIVLKAINYIKKDIPELVFQIAGEGSHKKVLQDYVDINELNGQVKFLGWKKYDEMMKILLESDIAIIPHLRSVQTDNSSPNKLYLYAYQKKPILASDCISIKRILADLDCGLTYSSQNYVELGENIIKLYNDHESCERMGQAGYEAVVREYNWEISSKVLVELYKELEGYE